MVSIDKVKELGQPADKIESDYLEARVLRRVSPYLTKFLIEQGVSANQVTVFTIIVLISASLLMMFKSTLVLVSYLLYLVVFNLLDNVDGEIARTTNTLTKLGQRLEELQFIILSIGYFFGFGVWLYNTSRIPFFVVLGIVSAGAATYVHLRGYLVLELINNEKDLQMENGLIGKGKRLNEIYEKYSKIIYFFSIYKIGFIIIIVLEVVYAFTLGCTGAFLSPASLFFVIQSIHWVLLSMLIGIVTTFSKCKVK